jgi:hypothetical protein
MARPKDSRFAGLVTNIRGQAAEMPDPSMDRVEKEATASPAPAPEPRTAMTYRPLTRNHDRLRRISFETRRSMQDLVDEAVEAWLVEKD